MTPSSRWMRTTPSRCWGCSEQSAGGRHLDPGVGIIQCLSTLVLGALRAQQAREHAHIEPGGDARPGQGRVRASWKQWKAWAGMEEVG